MGAAALRDFFEPVAAPRDEPDGGTAFREQLSERGTDGRRRAGDEDARPLDLHGSTCTGVPSGIFMVRSVMAALSMRMHPCETSCPSTDASLLPWMPISPSPPLKLSS